MDVMEVFIITQRYRTYESESEDSSSDDEWVFYLQKKLRSRIPNYINVVNSYMGHEFKSHFRLSRATFECLLEMLLLYLVRKIKGCSMIPPNHQLMIAVWKMATMDSYRSVCDRFNVGRATALRAVRRVTHGLFLKSSTFIKWPTGDVAVKVMRGFEESSSFPKTVEAIDGTHISNHAPKKNSVN